MRISHAKRRVATKSGLSPQLSGLCKATETRNCTGAFGLQVHRYLLPRTCRALTAAYPTSFIRRVFLFSTPAGWWRVCPNGHLFFVKFTSVGRCSWHASSLTFSNLRYPQVHEYFRWGSPEKLTALHKTVYHLAIQNVPT